MWNIHWRGGQCDEEFMKQLGKVILSKHRRGPFEWITGGWEGPDDCRVSLELFEQVVGFKPRPGDEFHLRQVRLRVIALRLAGDELDCLRLSSTLEEGLVQPLCIAFDLVTSLARAVRARLAGRAGV